MIFKRIFSNRVLYFFLQKTIQYAIITLTIIYKEARFYKNKK